MRSSGGWMLALVMAASTISSAARADDDAEAKRLFEQGRSALQAGHVGEACEHFAAAKKLAPQACGVVQNLALCRQQQGRDVEAYLEFDALTACASSAGQPDRTRFADEQRAALRAKLAFLQVTQSGGPKVERLFLDGTQVTTVARPQVVEPGKHRVEVEREGCAPSRLELDMQAGQSMSLVLPAQCDAQATTTSRATPAQTPAAKSEPPRASAEENKTRWQMVVGGAALGVGALAMVGSLAPCGVIALNQKDTDTDAARRTATICTGVAIGGAVLAATGVVFMLTAPSRKVTTAAEQGPRLLLAPQVSGARDWSLSGVVQF